MQPDGVHLVLWGEGDEFYAVFETTNGFTVTFDTGAKAYYYAKRSPDGSSLESTGVLAQRPPPEGLAQHIRMDQDAVAASAKIRRAEWESVTRVSERWTQLKALQLGSRGNSEAALGPSPPSTPTVGTKVGLTLLIDFPDEPATISREGIDTFLNGDNYTGYGNNGSVKSYFKDVSANRLTYSNVVTLYVRMARPKSYYNNVSLGCGAAGRALVGDALALLMARTDYANVILPTFSSLTTNAWGQVVAFNVLFAGSDSGVWAQGLWPHSYGLAYGVALGNGKMLSLYQLTDIDSSPQIGTFCHENGHMLCGFPDIYDYDYDSTGGAGRFCLMDYGCFGGNPAQVCAYLKFAAGWATATDLTPGTELTGTLIAAPTPGYDHFYRYRRPGVSTEYFILENRQPTGRDGTYVSGGGVAVWHIDELGNHDNQSLIPNPYHQNYEVTLVQADNQWHFQNYNNTGDANDFYYQGNSSAGYANLLKDDSAPNARWWDGTPSGLSLGHFSQRGQAMTFQLTSTQVNCWTNLGSGTWESANWSLGVRPGPGQTIIISNAGWKAVAINPPTRQSYPETLVLRNLNLSAPTDASNTLLLNYFGSEPPLHLTGSASVGTNSRLMNLYSGLVVDQALTITNGTYEQDHGTLCVTNGDTAMNGGEWIARDAAMQLRDLLLGRLGASSFRQTGGTNQAANVTLSSGSGYFLTNGTLDCHWLIIGETETPAPAVGYATFVCDGDIVARNLEMRSRMYLTGSSRSNRLRITDGFSLTGDLYLGDANETLPALMLGESTLNLQPGRTILRFGQSTQVTWIGKLLVNGWNGGTQGGGEDQILFGNSAQGLTPGQLNQIIFVSPAGFPTGTYSAKILATGEVVPTAELRLLSQVLAGEWLLSWPANCVLQSSTNVTGPYTDMIGTSSPYTNRTMDAPSQFFRLRRPW